jgi:2-(1,2-epoxy-1,2-dihydrophenyl)acetyl-CoA isomerase
MTDRYETLLLEIDEGVARLTLNRPDKLNSFTQQMHEELRAAFDRIEAAVAAANPLRALLLTGAGRAFCSGQDLAERRIDPADAAVPAPDLGRSLRANYNPLVLRLERLPIPVIAAVNGVAAGAGANLALACDLVVAARSARFIEPFCRLGLVPDAGGTWILPRLIGLARTKALTLLGEPLSAEQAQAWGLIWKVVDDAQLMPEALELANRLARQATSGFALQKRAFAASFGHSLEEQLELEADLQTEAGHSADFAEGVAAFLEKREARFRGR